VLARIKSFAARPSCCKASKPSPHLTFWPPPTVKGSPAALSSLRSTEKRLKECIRQLTVSCWSCPWCSNAREMSLHLNSHHLPPLYQLLKDGELNISGMRSFKEHMRQLTVFRWSCPWCSIARRKVTAPHLPPSSSTSKVQQVKQTIFCAL
jgi:hypothetical protein